MHDHLPLRRPRPRLFPALSMGLVVLCAGALAATGATILSEDFATLTDTTVPGGWTASRASDLDYPSEPYAGIAAPAFKWTATGQWLTSPAFGTGATNLQFWAYGNGGAGSTLAVSSLVSGAWTLAGTLTIAQSEGTYSLPLNSQATQIKFNFTKSFNCALDDIVIQGTAGPVEDPNLVAPASLPFGTVSPGALATQVLSLANSGATLTLHLTSLSPASGDTNKFTAGALPAALAPGATAAVAVVYAPGAVTGAAHSAVFNLLSDDPSTPAQAITFSGATMGAALTISNVQYSASGTSTQAGSRVYVSGIATYADPSGYALADPAGGPWSGVYVADIYHRPDPGDRVYLEGLVQETAGLTLLTNITRYSLAGTGQAVPLATVRGNQVTNEAYEGVLVRITNAVVQNTNYNGGRVYWQASDGYAFLVGTRTPYRYIWTNNARLTAIQGLVFTNFVQPRFDADFVGRPVFEYALRGLVITPDGPRTNWTVHVRDDVIVAVTNAAIPGITNLDTGGIIFPGLIDAHNHPAYNSFPTLMFNHFPFGHRDEWGEADTEYSNWKTVRGNLRTASSDSSNDDITKYGECLELMAGCIAIQGQSNTDAEHSHPNVILKNIEQFPSRIYADIFPWRMSNSTDRTTLLDRVAGGAVNATIIHLCEGTDSTARAQFTTWKNWGMLNKSTTIIHGAALAPADFADMAAVGAKLVWSPMSNMKLYAGTANIKAAKDAGVLVGISPDWTPSGCFNILEELGYAWQLNTTIFSNAYTAREMCDMVTLNNAICAGLENHYGKIAAGYNAGLAVIEGDPARYSNLLVQTIATNRPNTPAHESVAFTVGFRDMHTNYVFVFETRDARGNVRTTVTTNSFKLAYHTGGDTDRDGLPNEWESQYFGSFSGAVAAANADGDWLDNYQEFVASTAPNNSNSVLSRGIEAAAFGTNRVLDLPSPFPTSTGRVYDVWRSTNLLGQIAWQPLGLNVRGAADGSAVTLRVTNTLPAATYRTGVRLP